MIQNLIRTSASPTAATVRSIRDQMTQTKVNWTFEMARDLSSLVMRLHNYRDSHNASIPEGYVASLALLTLSLEQWPDDLVYAVVINDRNIQGNCTNLLDMLMIISKRDDQLRFTALVGIASVVGALDRLQRLTSLDANAPDSAWWFTEDDCTYLAECTFQIIRRSQNDDGFHVCSDDMGIPTPEQTKLSSIFIIFQLLKHGWESFRDFFNDEELKTLTSRLVVHLRVLISAETPNTSPEKISIALCSINLLSLVQNKLGLDLPDFDRMIQATAIVEDVAQFVFSVPDSCSAANELRWMWDEQFAPCKNYAFETIQIWSICNNAAWSIFTKQESHLRSFLETSWNRILLEQHSSQTGTDILSKLLLLHTSYGIAARNVLAATIEKASKQIDETRTLYQRLLSRLSMHLDHPSHNERRVSARLLWILLCDRKGVGTHDNMSIGLWAAVDTDLVGQYMEAILDIASTDAIRQPYLLILLDLLMGFCGKLEFCDYLLGRLGAKGVEKLVFLVRPSEIKVDFMSILDNGNEGVDEITPPANNLSRLDEASICVEHEEESEPRGFDHTVRLAAACVLSRLGYHSSLTVCENLGHLISRICTAVNDFLARLQEAPSSFISTDIFQRSFRLLVSVTTEENEEFVSTLLFAQQVLQHQRLRQLREENECQQQRILEGLKREEQLEAQKQKHVEQSRVYEVVLKRELVKMKKSATQDARQVIAIHVAERSNAETRAAELEQNLKQSEERVRELSQRVQDYEIREGRVKEELDLANSTVDKLQNRNQEMSRLMQEEVAKSGEVEERLDSASNEIESLRARQSTLEGEVAFHKSSNKQTLANLEDLFSDMVRLTQIYQFQEKEWNSLSKENKGTVEKLESNLNSEKMKSKEMADTLDSLRSENEKLYRKVEKYKDRLERERQEREDEKLRRKRNNPLSYMNQLHESQRSSRSNRENDGSSSRPSKSRVEKENSYFASSSSQRRKNI
eukprot:scaffold1390_cov138-Cylindrotheca_fusiformis.AAC.10